MSEQLFGAGRDDGSLVIGARECLDGVEVRELRDRHELYLIVGGITSQQVGAVVTPDAADARQNIRPQQCLVLIRVLVPGPAVPDSADHDAPPPTFALSRTLSARSAPRSSR